MTNAVNQFYTSIEDVNLQSQTKLIDFFVYYLTVIIGQSSATTGEINQCFVDCDLSCPKGTSSRLAEGIRSKPQKFLKSGNGYKLHRHLRESIAGSLGSKKQKTQTNATLRALESKLHTGSSRDFLSETLDCFDAGANRATIVMAWILTMNHMFDYIMNYKLSEFNTALGKNTDKRVKVVKILNRDDFSDIPEGKFIEFCRSGKIISNDVRKILDQKLDVRNTCAHPSGVKVNETKVIDFVEDLVQNIVLKYEI